MGGEQINFRMFVLQLRTVKKWPGKTERTGRRIRVRAVGVRQQSDFEIVMFHAVERD